MSTPVVTPLFKRLSTAAVALVIGVAGLAAGSARPAHAAVTGKTPYLVLMCKFADVASEPFTPSAVSDFFSETGKGKGGMYDFFHDLSYGAFDLTGTTVKGWYPMAFRTDDEKRWEQGGQVTAGSNMITLTAGTFRSSDVGKLVYVQSDASSDTDAAFTSTITSVNSPTQATMAATPTLKDLGTSSLSGVYIGLGKSRAQYIQDCVDSATSQDPTIDPSRYYSIIAVVNAPHFDSGAANGRAIFDATGMTVGLVGHEMGHTLGLQHSWSDQPQTDPKTGQVNPYTEYGDPYDLMSYANVKGFKGGMALNGMAPSAGPGLNAPYLDQLGWMPAFRQSFYTPGTTLDLALVPLSHTSGTGSYEVIIPMADHVGYPGHYLTVEYRYPDGWDQGISSPAVLIHEVLPDGRSILLTKATGGPWSAYSVFHDPADNVAVGIGAFDNAYYPHAWIEVSPDYPGGTTPTRPLPAPPVPPTGCAATVAYPEIVTMTCDGIGTYDAFDLKSEQTGYGIVSTDATIPHTIRPTMTDDAGPTWPVVNYTVCRRNPLGSACTAAIPVSMGHGWSGGGNAPPPTCPPGPPALGGCKPPIAHQ
jgi:hypothetical protein